MNQQVLFVAFVVAVLVVLVWHFSMVQQQAAAEGFTVGHAVGSIMGRVKGLFGKKVTVTQEQDAENQLILHAQSGAAGSTTGVKLSPAKQAQLWATISAYQAANPKINTVLTGAQFDKLRASAKKGVADFNSTLATVKPVPMKAGVPQLAVNNTAAVAAALTNHAIAVAADTAIAAVSGTQFVAAAPVVVSGQTVVSADQSAVAASGAPADYYNLDGSINAILKTVPESDVPEVTMLLNKGPAPMSGAGVAFSNDQNIEGYKAFPTFKYNSREVTPEELQSRMYTSFVM